ncbi:unnamed protein product [Nyctereutes procyonoides]|uniref:(raccoon dog) hypothetical protein n=1 Tax=Nyctereutes procyonoides TaxID=34880 RepID=A0A811ZZS1_NYCPR|nr:unnamed protein product [Nyctereutes procyonoides]
MYDFCIGKNPVTRREEMTSIVRILLEPMGAPPSGGALIHPGPTLGQALLQLLGIQRAADRAAAQKICLFAAQYPSTPTGRRLKIEHQLLPEFPDCQPVSSFESLLSIPETPEDHASLQHTPASPTSLPLWAFPLSTYVALKYDTWAPSVCSFSHNLFVRCWKISSM